DDVRKVDWPADDIFGETTCNIGVIAGGQRANVIADSAEATLLLRVAVEANHAQAILEQTVAGRATIDYKSGHNPVKLSTAAGFESMIARFTTDIPYLSKWGRPFLIGPGSILVAHTDPERVNKSELLKAVDLYVNLVKSL
ncbi:MAG TPA: peptidase dimerization domain-containing protein, partial [Pyrinomonadaceae bacterium]|nr:peptidase dimerization domain-containing protein [Pyrinomonadaceae bacterium]